MNMAALMPKPHKYPIGTKFQTRGKHPKSCTVTDCRTVLDAHGAIVDHYYVATHEFMGQVVTDRHVLELSITMGLVSAPEPIADETSRGQCEILGAAQSLADAVDWHLGRQGTAREAESFVELNNALVDYRSTIEGATVK